MIKIYIIIQMIIYMIFKWGGGAGGSKGENCPGGLLMRGVQNERNFQKGHSSNDEIMANAQCSEKFR